MSNGRRRGFVILIAGVALAFALRALPLYWSGLPSTLDGFDYAWLAKTTTETGSIPLTQRADNLVFSTYLSVVSLVTDAVPVRAIQPLATVVGGVICFVGGVVARRVLRDSGSSDGTATAVGAVTATLLAVQGLFLRRTTVPDEEILGILLVITLAFCLHLALRSRLRRWWLVVGLLLVVFPMTHTFSTFIAALVVTALVVRHVSVRLSLRSVLGPGALAVAFWAYMFSYYRFAESSTTLSVPYVNRVMAYPGLFLAWLILLAIGIVWVQQTGRRVKQVSYLAVVGSFFGIVGLNAVSPIFPGTTQTPPLILGLVAILGVFAVTAAFGLELFESYRGGAIPTAMFLAPVTIIGFGLTASLTPEYYDTVMRAQTFLHVPAAMLVGVVLVRLLQGVSRATAGRTLRLALVALVLVSTLATAPLAYLTMDTATVPTTTYESEFEGVRFASTHTDAPWVSDHSLTRVGAHYFKAQVGYSAVANWLSGGPSPDCLVISQRSWTTTGAHLFPNAPETVSATAYAEWTATRNVVYANTGNDPVVVSRPVGNATCAVATNRTV
ncbi:MULTISPECIES: hypothetical protein [Haloferax]|uniref:hypothetical protein n=1 Tax=Haloferax TaxID=2251 RepID=UPI001F288C11|nr:MULTISPECIES: hypothetical protein [Haloferax]